MTTIDYQNGNCSVSIDMRNGTKTRTYDGDPCPDFPESVDLKITDCCDIGCVYCHESSTPNGEHAAYADLLRIVAGLPSGVEVAVGGGNPIEFPCLNKMLVEFRGMGLVSNITLRTAHAAKAARYIQELRAMSLIHGLGLSDYCHLIEQIWGGLIDANTVLHYIVGIDSPHEVRHLIGKDYKILILGYKQRGRGVAAYDEKVKTNIGAWAYFLRPILNKKNLLVSFDNLALEQLRVHKLVSKDVWQDSYMGDDGQFSMFVDAVKMEYAASSVDADRFSMSDMTIREAFQKLKSN